MKKPWIISKEKNNVYIVSSPDDEYAIARAFADGPHSAEEVANKIVRAVNSHDQLVAALKIAEKFCGSLTADECPDSVHIPIRAALAAAGEQS